MRPHFQCRAHIPGNRPAGNDDGRSAAGAVMIGGRLIALLLNVNRITGFMLRVYYTQATEGLAEAPAWAAAYRRLLERTPPARGQRLERFRHRQAWITSAAGLLLLEYTMREAGFADFALAELVYPEDRKPCCPGRPDFNISHSHSAVYCALAEQGRVGVDVEKIRPLDTAGFERMIDAQELAEAGGDTPFFEVWTRKEAVLKAQGRSGVWDMHRVSLDFEQQNADFKGERWQVRALPADAGYAAALAWRDGDDHIRCEPVEAARLLAL
jgi:4'-phosphopantetheinyl transferase